MKNINRVVGGKLGRKNGLDNEIKCLRMMIKNSGKILDFFGYKKENESVFFSVGEQNKVKDEWARSYIKKFPSPIDNKRAADIVMLVNTGGGIKTIGFDVKLKNTTNPQWFLKSPKVLCKYKKIYEMGNKYYERYSEYDTEKKRLYQENQHTKRQLFKYFKRVVKDGAIQRFDTNKLYHCDYIMSMGSGEFKFVKVESIIKKYIKFNEFNMVKTNYKCGPITFKPHGSSNRNIQIKLHKKVFQEIGRVLKI
jgi:hypothetical protein